MTVAKLSSNGPMNVASDTLRLNGAGAGNHKSTHQVAVMKE
jgi:hypothetical protein